MGHYGYTCDKCPLRGLRGEEDDWVGYTRTKGKLVGYRRSLNLAYPIRCKSCNRRYNSYKRAREAVARLDIVRQTFQDFGGAKWKYLKFLTVTWPIKLTTDPMPPIEKMKSKWVETRNEIAKQFNAQGGTDVMEVVTKEVDGKYSHNIHFHSIWCSPYIDLKVLQATMKNAGVGRHEYTILKEDHWEDDRGQERVQSAFSVAIEYLAKYLTKAEGAKRMTWGELRKWKEYLDDDVCRICVKTTHDLKKEYPCKCEPNNGASEERS